MRRAHVLNTIAFLAACLLTGAVAGQQRLHSVVEKKTLIVYLSRTNNTKAVAEMIHGRVGGELVALELQTPYPANYHSTVEQVVHENETSYLPPLKTVIEHPDRYDRIFIGFPTWDMKLPPPMKSFLHQAGPLSRSTRMPAMAQETPSRRCVSCVRRAPFYKASPFGVASREMDSSSQLQATAPMRCAQK